MSVPVVGSYASELYRDVQPLAYADQQNGYPLLAYCGAIGAMFQTVRDLARDDAAGNPGWSLLLDVDRCPSYALPWLAQFVGATIDASLDDAGQRQQIRAEQRMARGTPAAIVAAAQRHLIGTQTVVLVERDGDPYTLTVVTYTSETPNSSAVLAALTAAKPAGLILNYEVLPGQTYGQLAALGLTYAAIPGAFADYAHLRDNH